MIPNHSVDGFFTFQILNFRSQFSYRLSNVEKSWIWKIDNWIFLVKERISLSSKLAVSKVFWEIPTISPNHFVAKNVQWITVTWTDGCDKTYCSVYIWICFPKQCLAVNGLDRSQAHKFNAKISTFWASNANHTFYTMYL